MRQPKPLILIAALAGSAVGIGASVASVAVGAERPKTWTPQTITQEREAAKACQTAPKACPTEEPWAEFTESTGFIPVTDPTGQTRTPIGYIRRSDLLDGARRADTEIPIYADATASRQVGTTSGTEGTRVAK